MPNTLQDFLADSTLKTAQDLEAALLQLPGEKWNWSAGGQARGALDMVAECALMNGAAVAMIRDGVFPPDMAFRHYAPEIEALCDDWPALHTLLHQNAALVASVIRQVPDADLPAQSESMFYALWNMTYHMAQINFIAAQRGCLND